MNNRHSHNGLNITSIGIVFLGLFSLGLMFPFQVAAEQVLAAIATADLPRYQKAHNALVNVLKAGGFGEDKIKIFKQTPNADKMSLANSIRRAEAAGATLVVAYGSRAADAAREELKSTPLLFADVYDPVALEVVKTLEAPGTDASGATCKTDLSVLVENLVAIKSVKTVGILYSQSDKGSEQQLKEMRAVSQSYGFSIKAENVRNSEEALSLASKLLETSDALFLTESVIVTEKAKEILTKASSVNAIVFSQTPGLVESGALIGLEADPEEQGKLVAVHVLQALQGQKVHLLPVRQAKKVSLYLNKQTADQLGLSIPSEVASKAKLM